MKKLKTKLIRSGNLKKKDKIYLNNPDNNRNEPIYTVISKDNLSVVIEKENKSGGFIGVDKAVYLIEG